MEVALPKRAGVPVRPLLDRLSFVRRKDSWGQYFRSGLATVGEEDARALERAVRAKAHPREESGRGHPEGAVAPALPRPARRG